MKQGKSLTQLANELDRQAKMKKDFVSDTRQIRFATANGQSLLTLPQANPFTVSDIAHKQIADRLQIPTKYYERMRSDYPDLLDENVNSWFQKTPERRMIRTLDGKARAFLSDRYRRLDNLDLAEAVLPVISEMRGADIISCELTETRLYLKVVNKTLKAEVKTGDVVQAGLVISNSEVGLGALRVEPLLYRLVCQNGLIAQDFAQKKYHVGRAVDSEDAAIFRDETLIADDKAFFLKVQDVVRTAVDKTQFQLLVDRMRFTTRQELSQDPMKSVELLADRFQWNQTERGSVLRHFIMGGDLSGYGMLNAVTHTSQHLHDYERATEFERMGGELLKWDSAEWNKIGKVA